MLHPSNDADPAASCQMYGDPKVHYSIQRTIVHLSSSHMYDDSLLSRPHCAIYIEPWLLTSWFVTCHVVYHYLWTVNHQHDMSWFHQPYCVLYIQTIWYSWVKSLDFVTVWTLLTTTVAPMLEHFLYMYIFCLEMFLSRV